MENDKISSFIELKSHPNKLLEEHLKEVGELSKEIVETKNIRNKQFLAEVAYLIGIAHDFGKATTFFQNKIHSDEKTQYAKHSCISSLFCYYLIQRYFPNENYRFRIYGWIVVRRHHGNLRKIHPTEYNMCINRSEKEILKKQIENLLTKREHLNKIYRKLLNNPQADQLIDEFFNELRSENTMDKFLKKIKFELRKLWKEKNIEHYFSILFLYSVLLDADKLSGCNYGRLPLKNRETLDENIVDKHLFNNYRIDNEGGWIDGLRKKAYKQAIENLNKTDIKKNKIFCLTLPTGLGKTLTGMSVAIKLRNRVSAEYGFLPKIIYAAPFLSIIDQNKRVYEDVLKNAFEDIPSTLFFAHHHLSDILYRENNEEEKLLEPEKALVLIEGWHSEIIVTTFMQLFYSLITNRNRAIRKFHNIVNSIIILDEPQTMPVKYWKLMERVLNYFTNEYNCFVILMSATQPLIFEDRMYIELTNESYFKDVNRYIIKFNVEYSLEEFKNILIEKIKNTDKDIMIILNTIESCKNLYANIKKEFNGKATSNEFGVCRLEDGTLLFNLSTNIIPLHRLKRIEKIRESSSRKIIITTQLVEAGVDISSSIVFRDFSPFDSIIQSAGRCNRHFEIDKGIINVVTLFDKHNRYFYQYIYDPVLMDATKKVVNSLSKNELEENSFVLSNHFRYREELLTRVSSNESDMIMSSIEKLDFDKISEFKLIEEDMPNVDIFIEIDDKATECLKTYKKKIEELKNADKTKVFALLAEIEQNKRYLYQYTISVPITKKQINELENVIENIETFKIVRKENLENYYDIETGFRNDKPVSYDIL